MNLTKIVSIVSLMVCLPAKSAFKIKAHFTDDLPIIRDNIKKGFLETQSKVSSWVTSLRRKIDGDDDDIDDDEGRPPRTNPGLDPRSSRLPSGSRRGVEPGRRSVDRDRYDADPQVLGDDFTNLHLHDLDGKTYHQSSLNPIPADWL